MNVRAGRGGSGLRVSESTARTHSVVRRGIVAEAPLAAASPLIAVPEHALLTTDAAVDVLSERLARAASPLPLPSAQHAHAVSAAAVNLRASLEPPLLLALLLAAERAQGPASRWAPYLASLPAHPSCAWALPRPQLSSALQALGPRAAGWRGAVEAAAAAAGAKAARCGEEYGAALGVGANEVLWGLGHIVSRSFGAGVSRLGCEGGGVRGKVVGGLEGGPLGCSRIRHIAVTKQMRPGTR